MQNIKIEDLEIVYSFTKQTMGGNEYINTEKFSLSINILYIRDLEFDSISSRFGLDDLSLSKIKEIHKIMNNSNEALLNTKTKGIVGFLSRFKLKNLSDTKVTRTNYEEIMNYYESMKHNKECKRLYDKSRNK